MPIEQTLNKSKHVIRIIHCKDRFAHAEELFRESKILNVFQLNILNNLVFMHKIKSQTAPKIFQNKFHKPIHKCPTNFSTSNYSIPPFQLSKSKYRISIRGPHYGLVFKNSMRKKLLELENEILYF